MDELTLTPDPDLTILHRKGAFFAAWLSGIRPPVPLSQLDLCLMAGFLGGHTEDEVVEEAANGRLSPFLPAASPESNVRARIRQLAQGGTLIAEGAAPAVSPAAIGITDCDSGGNSPPDLALRLGTHFGLRAGSDGFVVWSAVDSREYVLELELTLLLCAFGQGAPTRQVTSGLARLGEEDSLLRAIAWLHGTGLLAPVVKSASSAIEPVPVHVVTEGAGQTIDWRALEPDGRIPVYFTPHMENHFPLALGMMYSAIQAHDQGAMEERFRLLPIEFLSPKDLFEGPYRKFGQGVWLFSNYMWSLDINLQVSAGIKAHDPGNFCIHGGPSTPGYKEACTAFMAINPHVDTAVHGEGEVTIVELLDSLVRRPNGGIGFDEEDIRGVQGLTFRQPESGDLIWTAPRDRMREPDCIPSPYLTGVFDAYHGRVEAAIVESNRGCPFGCTFCDWGSATRQKVRKYDLERVRREIEWIGRNRIRVLWIADANFGMYDRDVELARFIVETKAKHGHPREVVVNYTKNTNKRLIEIIRAFSDGGIISQGIISIQTTDEATLEVINRKNIKTDKYDELAEVFSEARLPLSTDLMIGLPGITVAAWDRDLQRYFDADVSVKAYPTQLLPNSPMADPDYRRKYRIEVDENDFVISCHSFNRQELEAMKAIYYTFEVADGYGLMRYVLRFLQWDHGIQALDVLHRLLSTARSEPRQYPALTWILRFFLAEKAMPGGWRRFYSELEEFICGAFDIAPDTGLATTLAVNELVMPDDTLAYPRSRQLAHDFEAWFRDRSAGGSRRLADYPPGSFSVDDPDLMAHIDMDYLQYDSHQYFWELRSGIARPKSVADIREPVGAVA